MQRVTVLCPSALDKAASPVVVTRLGRGELGKRRELSVSPSVDGLLAALEVVREILHAPTRGQQLQSRGSLLSETGQESKNASPQNEGHTSRRIVARVRRARPLNTSQIAANKMLWTASRPSAYARAADEPTRQDRGRSARAY